ncbi:DUF6807 family protein [Microcella sp.]|uniref:DUF6807 family protein n=1 Tax=Microcella sp. TaxID=1913979 RepID=UPI002564CE90|nr:DUF6807 family protein [Microcella sp.]MBX9472498.1 PmoA family protein [Microcella sp.]
MTVAPARDLLPGITLHAPDAREQQGSPRPWLHPITSPAGVVATDDQPDDHPWHRGLSLAVANVALDDGSGLAAPPHNFWGGPTFVEGDYVQLANNGSQKLIERRLDHGSARETLAWRTVEGRTIVHESRRITAAVVSPTATRLQWQSSLTGTTSAAVRFGSPTTAGRPQAGYGGLFVRGARALLGAEVLLDGAPVDPSAAMGARADWAALRSPGLTIALASDPANPVSPAPWFVRVDPVVMLCAAPFFHAEWRLEPGETVTWRWTVLVVDGAPSASQLGDLLA